MNEIPKIIEQRRLKLYESKSVQQRFGREYIAIHPILILVENCCTIMGHKIAKKYVLINVYVNTYILFLDMNIL